MQIFQQFGSESRSQDDYRFFLIGCSSGTYDLTLLTSFQRFVVPSIYNLSASRRLEIARAYCGTSIPRDHPDPNILKFLVKENGSLLSIDLVNSIQNGFSIIHTIALSFGRVCRMRKEPTRKGWEGRLTQWGQLAMEIIALSQPEGIHGIEEVQHGYSVNVCPQIDSAAWVGTPLLTILKGCSLDYFEEIDPEAANLQELWRSASSFALKTWLEQLVNCAVDLREYGGKEKEIFSQSPGDLAESFDFVLNFSQWIRSKQKYVKETILVRLRDFKFGPSIGDWVLNWEFDAKEKSNCDESEASVKLLSCNALFVPGAWVD
jgi:hypothetical protein